MNKTQLTMEMENLRFHRDMLTDIYDVTVDPLLRMEIKTEIRTTIKTLKELDDKYLNLLVTEIKNTYPQADAVYEDKIVEIVGDGNLVRLMSKGKIQLCACINGRRLYAI